MKSAWPPEMVRLATAALESRDALRRLAATIDSAGTDSARQVEALKAARSVAAAYSDILRQALKHTSTARPRTPEAQSLWNLGRYQ